MLLATPFQAEALQDLRLLAEAEDAFHVGLEHRDDPSLARAPFLLAATRYDQMRSRGADNPELDRNLANAYLLGGDVSRAILAYRRGLRFAPSDRRLLDGLACAREQVGYPPGSTLGRPAVEQRPPWLPRVASSWYLTAAIAAHGLSWLAAARWWMTRRAQWLALAACGFCVTLLLSVGLLAEEWRDWDLTEHPIVVIADDGVLLRTGNGLSYPPRFEIPLNRGVEARLLFIRGDWLQIELSGGEVGWVPREYAVCDFSA
jgi:hypothetical protein